MGDQCLWWVSGGVGFGSSIRSRWNLVLRAVGFGTGEECLRRSSLDQSLGTSFRRHEPFRAHRLLSSPHVRECPGERGDKITLDHDELHFFGEILFRWFRSLIGREHSTAA